MRKFIYGALAFLVLTAANRVRLLFNRTDRIVSDGISSVKSQELVANVALGLAVVLLVAVVGVAVHLHIRKLKSEAALVAARKDPFFEEPEILRQLEGESESSVSARYREAAREAARLLVRSRRLVESFEKHTVGEELAVLATVKRELFTFRLALLGAASSVLRRIEVSADAEPMLDMLDGHWESFSEAERLVEAAFAYMESREVNQEVDLKNLATSLRAMVGNS